jgi:hypothetical protein
MKPAIWQRWKHITFYIGRVIELISYNENEELWDTICVSRSVADTLEQLQRHEPYYDWRFTAKEPSFEYLPGQDKELI